MDEAKNAAPVFAKQVLSAMSEKIVGAHEATMEATGPVRYAMPPLSLTAVVALASKEAHYKFRLIEESALEKLPLRFPVQVQSKQTRVFLEYQAKALGASLAGIAGAILDQVVKASLTEKS